MDTQRKIFCRLAKERKGKRDRTVTVVLPLPYEGIGNALRSSYVPMKDSLPDDILGLLAKLDGR